MVQVNQALLELFRGHGVTAEPEGEWIVFPGRDMRAAAAVVQENPQGTFTTVARLVRPVRADAQAAATPPRHPLGPAVLRADAGQGDGLRGPAQQRDVGARGGGDGSRRLAGGGRILQPAGVPGDEGRSRRPVRRRRGHPGNRRRMARRDHRPARRVHRGRGLRGHGRRRIPDALADRAYRFTQTAWARVLLDKLGVRSSPDYVCFDGDGNVVETGRLADEPCFAAASRLAPRYAGSPEFGQLTLMSADVNALNDALHAGSQPQDLVATPAFLFLAAPTEAGMADAQRVIDRYAAAVPRPAAKPAKPEGKKPAGQAVVAAVGLSRPCPGERLDLSRYSCPGLRTRRPRL